MKPLVSDRGPQRQMNIHLAHKQSPNLPLSISMSNVEQAIMYPGAALTSALQEQVIARARVLMTQFPWFKGGVCLDDLPTDEEIIQEGIEDGALRVVMDTAYWDAPNFFDPTSNEAPWEKTLASARP